MPYKKRASHAPSMRNLNEVSEAERQALARLRARFDKKREKAAAADRERSLWPRPDRIGEDLSEAQMDLLHRLATCPTAISWSGGFLFSNNAPYPDGLGYAHVFNASSMKALWDKGFLDRTPDGPGDVAVAKAAERILNPERLALWRAQWRAVVELHGELVSAWDAWRAAGCPDDGSRPPMTTTHKSIQERMRQHAAAGGGAA